MVTPPRRPVALAALLLLALVVATGCKGQKNGSANQSAPDPEYNRALYDETDGNDDDDIGDPNL